jgi:hypothetical protein
MRWIMYLTGWVLLPLLPTMVRGEDKAPRVDQAAINRAIDRGVAALKQMQKNDGNWNYTSFVRA